MKTLIEQIGGEDAVIKLVNHFYDLVETTPKAQNIHRLHFRGHGLTHTRQQQVNFLTGFMGGRQYYREEHGHMDLREIHAHIPIRNEDAEIWLALMQRALDDCGHKGAHIDALNATLRRAALMLVNDIPDWRLE